jgi:hypothetical protein
MVGLVDSQRRVPVRGWGAGGVAGGPSQRWFLISLAPSSRPQPFGQGRRIFLRPLLEGSPNQARATVAASM